MQIGTTFYMCLSVFRLPKVLLETRDDREDINGESITRPSRVTIRSDSRRLAHDQTLYAESKSILTADSCKMAARSLHSTITKQPRLVPKVVNTKMISTFLFECFACVCVCEMCECGVCVQWAHN